MARDVQTKSTVRSDDGTTIAFECAGEGPPVILIGGALSSGVRDFPPFLELGRLLEPRLTVYRSIVGGVSHSLARAAEELVEARKTSEGS